ncbi:MAG: glycosyltransferase family 2 protein [Candidatus Omnitrophica bacterium]|nr:glycosyltransferase family 2 protein [Candidatus Omnitrophota bacterium]
MFLTIVIACVILTVLQHSFIANFFFVTEKNLLVKHPPYTPKVSIIIPCRGIDPHFDTSIKSILNQDYPDYEIVFATSDEEDPAYARLQELIQNHACVKAQIVIAGHPTISTGKLNNLVAGVGQVRADSEILVFMDSDTCPQPKWLEHLIAPMQYPHVGITTGIPVYVPLKHTFWSLVKSMWMAGLGAFVTVKRFRGCYGGAMAVRKKHFDQFNVREIWKTALTDDLTLSMALKPTGTINYFVPQCMVPIYEGTNLIDFIKWANRQSLLSRVYFRKQWAFVAVMFALRMIFMVASPIVFLSALFTGSLGLIHWIFLCPVYVAVYNGILLMKATDDAMRHEVAGIHKITRWYPVLAPTTQILAIVNFVIPLFARKMTWRGITYKFTSSTEVIVEKR